MLLSCASCGASCPDCRRAEVRAGDWLGRLPLLGLFALVIAYLLAGLRLVPVNDLVSAAGAAWSLVGSGDLDVAGEPWATRWDRPGPLGTVSDRMPGVWLPLVFPYAVAHVLGFPFSVVPALVFGALLAALAVFLFYQLLDTIVAGWRRLVLVAWFGLSAPQWLVAGAGFWPHTVTGPALLGGLLAVSRQGWAPAGALFGLAVLARPTLAPAVAVLGLGLSYSLQDRRPVLILGAWSTLAVGLIFGWARLTGSPSLMPGSYAGQFSTATDPENLFSGSWWQHQGSDAASILLSPERGWLWFVPLLLVLVPMLPAAWALAPAWARWSAGAGLAVLVAQVAANGYAAGHGFFGPRYGYETAVLLLPLLGYAWRLLWTRAHVGLRTAAVAAVVVGVALAAAGSVSYVWTPAEPLARPFPWSAVPDAG